MQRLGRSTFQHGPGPQLGRTDQGQFDKTRWSMVLEAVQSRAPGAPRALAELCRRYWRPLYVFARRRGRTPEDSEDLVQGFFEHLIGSHGLAAVDRSKGRFRSFLLASFQNFIAAETRRARAEKRGGRAQLIRLDWRGCGGSPRFRIRRPAYPGNALRCAMGAAAFAPRHGAP